MNRLIPIGRAFFAIGLIGLGLDHFLFGEFVTGRAPAWPASIPGRPAWAYLSGLVFVVTAIQILAGRHARSAAIFAAALVFLWALLRYLPVLGASQFLSADWTNAGKALRFTGGALAIAATLPKLETGSSTPLSRFMNMDREFILAGRTCVGVTLVLNGIQHFMFVGFVASLIPGWFPGDARFWTYFGGIALIAGGVGLLIPRTAPPAALLSGLMVLSWFFIVHVSREIAGVADGIAVFEALLTSGILFVLTARAGAPRSVAAAGAPWRSPAGKAPTSTLSR